MYVYIYICICMCVYIYVYIYMYIYIYIYRDTKKASCGRPWWPLGCSPGRPRPLCGRPEAPGNSASVYTLRLSNLLVFFHWFHRFVLACGDFEKLLGVACFISGQYGLVESHGHPSHSYFVYLREFFVMPIFMLVGKVPDKPTYSSSKVSVSDHYSFHMKDTLCMGWCNSPNRFIGRGSHGSV